MEVHRKKWGLLSGRLVDDRMALLSHFQTLHFIAWSISIGESFAQLGKTCCKTER